MPFYPDEVAGRNKEGDGLRVVATHVEAPAKAADMKIEVPEVTAATRATDRRRTSVVQVPLSPQSVDIPPVVSLLRPMIPPLPGSEALKPSALSTWNSPAITGAASVSCCGYWRGYAHQSAAEPTIGVVWHATAEDPAGWAEPGVRRDGMPSAATAAETGRCQGKSRRGDGPSSEEQDPQRLRDAAR